MLTLVVASPVRADDAARYVQSIQESDGDCGARNGTEILAKNMHPTRKVRFWLDRMHMGVGTGSRSRTDPPPSGDAEALGFSRHSSGTREWRLARAQFVD